MNKIKLAASSVLKYRADIFIGAVQALLYILVCKKAFSMTGSIVLPLAISFVIPFLVTAISVFIKNDSRGIVSVGIAQLITVFFFIAFALIKELQINASAGWVPYWIGFFYFDKLLMLGSVWLASSLTVAVSRMISDKKAEYSLFFKLSSIAFAAFYFSLLFYSFVLIRLQTDEYPINLVPFSTVREYISDWSSIPYEVFMMFFGNLLYFTPLGYIFHIILRSKHTAKRFLIIFFFPLVAFSLLEISQYVFQNGYCEIDDMLMNSLGFWLGAALAPLCDKIAAKATKGRLKYFWG